LEGDLRQINAGRSGADYRFGHVAAHAALRVNRRGVRTRLFAAVNTLDGDKKRGLLLIE
jgi:hypothetical protein